MRKPWTLAPPVKAASRLLSFDLRITQGMDFCKARFHLILTVFNSHRG